ncbi:unnamed protein product [Closterium sp. NIES-64]|nr:unnamed protein product [Closterium sp. NIES-64]
MTRFAVAQHNAAKHSHSFLFILERFPLFFSPSPRLPNDSLQPVRVLDVDRPSAGNASAGGEEYLVSLAALNLLRGRTALFDALLSRRPLVAAQSATPAAALPLTATATTAENGGGEGGAEGWEYTLRSWGQVGWGHASTREEQEAALRHVVPVNPLPCGDLLTFVDSSDVDVQRVAREAVASANERQGSALLLKSVLEAQLVIPGFREYTLTLLLLASFLAFPPTGHSIAADLGAGGTGGQCAAANFRAGGTVDDTRGGNASGRSLVNVTWFAVVAGTQRNATAGEMGVAAAGGCAGRNASSSSAAGGGGSMFNSSSSNSISSSGILEWDLARAMAGVCVDEGWVLIPAAASVDNSMTPSASYSVSSNASFSASSNASTAAPYTDTYNGFSIRSLALFALNQLINQSSLPSNLTLLDVLAARANVVEGAGINYSVTVTAAVDAASAAGATVPTTTTAAEEEAGKQVVVLKLLVWQPVPFTAFRLVDFFLLDGGGGEGESGKQKQEGVLLVDCASPPPGHILLGNCTTVPKAGYSFVVAAIGFVTLLRVLVSLGLVLALL